MEERTIENNIVTLSGEIVSDFTYSHELYGEKFYIANLSAKRESGTEDIVPIMVSDRLVAAEADWMGRKIKISGQFRSYNKYEGNKSRLVLFVFAREFEEVEEFPFLYSENNIFLDGFICKEPRYRETPLGREIADILVAVNRPYGKSDYIPCIVWGRNARYASNLEVGTHISLEGRIQSREYEKVLEDGEVESRIAYEVSVSKVVVLEEMEGETDESRD